MADITALEAAIEAMSGAGEFDEQRLEADASFHRALGAATGNGYLASIMDYVSGRLKETTRATDLVYEDGDLVEITIQEHRSILDAVKSRDVETARQEMSTHIHGAAKRLGVEPPFQTS